MQDPNETPQIPEQSPLDYFYSLPGSPTKEQVEAWKTQVPNGVVRMFSPDGKRFFLMRGMSGLETRKVQETVPQNSSDPEGDFKIGALVLTCVWTSITSTGKLDEQLLRTGTAGLPTSLFAIVESLSDWFAPAQIMNMSFDL